MEKPVPFKEIIAGINQRIGLNPNPESMTESEPRELTEWEKHENAYNSMTDEEKEVYHLHGDALITNDRIDCIFKKLPKKYQLMQYHNYIGDVTKLKAIKTGAILTGGCGTGKTHLLIAKYKQCVIENSFLPPERRMCVKFYPVNEIILNIKKCFNKDSDLTEGEFIDRITESDVLFFDDFGAEKVSEYVTSIVYLVIDRIYRDCKTLYMSTNLDMGQIAKMYDDRIASRLCEMCEVIKITGSDYRVKK